MFIDFQKGQPSPDILPTELFSKAAVRALSRPNAATDVLQVMAMRPMTAMRKY